METWETGGIAPLFLTSTLDGGEWYEQYYLLGYNAVLKVNRCFGIPYRLHIQGQISLVRYQHESRWPAE
jgi:hypothetical protein